MERTALPPRVTLSVERPAGRTEFRKIFGMEDGVIGDVFAERFGQIENVGDAGELASHPRVIDVVGLAVGGCGQQDRRGRP